MNRPVEDTVTKNRTLLERSSLQNNVFHLYCLQAANYIIPLVTLPYLIRMLGAQSYGIMALAQAIVLFLVFLVDAGFNTRAVRELADPKVDHERANLIYVSSQWIKFGFSILALLILIGLMQIPSVAKHGPIYFASYLMVVGSLLFPTWLFQGLEIMRFTMMCSVLGRLLATTGIFLLVKSPDDLLVATILQSGATAISGLIAINVVRKLDFSWRLPYEKIQNEIVVAFKDVKALGPSEFFTTVMSNSGVFLISFFTTEAAVGVYAAVEKLARAAYSAFQPMLKALFPQIARHWFDNTDTQSSTYAMKWSIRLIAMSFGAAVGLYILSPYVLEIFFGNGWAEQSGLLRLFSLWLLSAITAETIGQFWILAKGDNRRYSAVLIISSALQFALCLIGAWIYAAVGLVLALVTTEITKCLMFTYQARPTKRVEHS